MLKTGTFLQNRYEIISRIGSGGMADVYKAKDHKLNRFVAVKVLKKEFKDDKVFISKFRVEAQAAAGLAHANIVNVYDVGEENGVNFIVMELVEGITLKVYITKKGKLTVRETTSIALQVAAGLEAAHNNGIIHRDVKPQNIIISMDGKAKIADFGIARAVSSNTINSNAMGSVHYSSPEQTRGGYSDAKSDIYSMGITMYEMLTGRVPFDGESTVAVALKHLQEEIQSPRILAPEIPFSTEQIILKCTQKSPDRRYSNMAELIRDLKESLVNPDGNFVTIAKLDSNAHTVMFSREEMDKIASSIAGGGAKGAGTPMMPAYDEHLNTGAAEQFTAFGNVNGDKRNYTYGGNYYQNSGYQDLKHSQEVYGGYRKSGHYQQPESYDDFETDPGYEVHRESKEKRKPGYLSKDRKKEDPPLNFRTERVITIVCIAAAVVIGCIFLALIGNALGIFHFSSTKKENNKTTETTQTGTEVGADKVTVPSLLGKTEAEAQSLLRQLGLGYKYQGETASSQYAKGQVVSQDVEANSSVNKNTTVGYTLSSGSAETLTIPSMVNVSQNDAETALNSMGLKVNVDNTRYSETVAEGYVITTNPGAGSNVKAGDAITIYVSQGKEVSSITVPDVTGHYVEDASQALNNLGLYVYITEMTSSTVEKGLVMYQDIESGSSVQTGTTVTITVSAGSPDPEIVIDPEGTWMCNAQLNAPEGYVGEPVRIELKQGDTVTTVFEGTTTFPYILNVEGQSGVTSGTAYVYTLDAQTWEVTSTTSYEGIIFSQVD